MLKSSFHLLNCSHFDLKHFSITKMNLNMQKLRGGTGRNGRGRGNWGRNKNVVVSVQSGGRRSSPKVSRKRNYSSTTTSSSKFETTSTSVHNSSSVSSEESRMIVAISEGRGEATCEVGLAAIDLTRPCLITCQIGDGHSYINTLRNLNLLNPSEILLPITFLEGSSPNRLLTKLKSQFKDTKITAIGRNMYNSQTGMDYIKNVCAKAYDSIILLLQHRHYALTASAALFQYIETSYFLFYTHNSIKIEYQDTEGLTLIDVSTADQLELVSSKHPSANKRFSSLYGILNQCITKIGARTLRSNILQPPCRLEEINERLNCISELLKSPDMIASINTILSKVSGIDQLLSLATIIPESSHLCKDRQLNYILLLNSLLQVIEPLSNIFENSKQPFFIQLRKTLKSSAFKNIQDLVQRVIHQDAHIAKGQDGVIQRCFCIKPGIHGMLDLMRKSYSERLDELREYVNKLGEKYNLDLTLSNSHKKGFHIVLKLDPQQRRTFTKADLPEEFIQLERLSSIITMKTMNLINFSSRIDNLMVEISKISGKIIYKLLLTIKEEVSLFYTLCEQIAKLDMLQSLALSSQNQYYIKPKFSDHLELVHAKHPLLDFLCHKESTANSILASNDQNMHIITGPNGSGKSVLIRQIFLLQVMSQVGSYVPAYAATFRISDRLLARIDLGDNMQLGASAFILEMKEISYFLNVMTDNTLIIIDELCRSTSLEEGTALAIGICEKLMQTKAYTFISTHYVPLAKISQMYYNIKAWQLQSIEKTKPNGYSYLEFTYNVIPGIVSLETYALHLARAIWPDIVMRYVENILEKLNKMDKVTCEFEEYDPRILLKYNLESELKIMKSKNQLCLQVMLDKLTEYQENLKKLRYELRVENLLQYQESSLAEQSNQSHQFTERHEDVEMAETSLYIEPEATYSQSSNGSYFSPGIAIENSQIYNPSQSSINMNWVPLGLQNNYPFQNDNNSELSHGNVLPSYTEKFTDLSATITSHEEIPNCSFKTVDQSIFKVPQYRPRKNLRKESENYFNIPSQIHDNNNDTRMNRFQIPFFTNLNKSSESNNEENMDSKTNLNNNLHENSVNSSISVSERQFSEPLLRNFGLTSTPINEKEPYSEPIVRTNKIGYKSDVFINNGAMGNKKQPDIGDKKIPDGQETVQSENDRITQAIKEELESISEYFTQTQEWDFEDEVPASSEPQDLETTTIIENHETTGIGEQPEITTIDERPESISIDERNETIKIEKINETTNGVLEPINVENTDDSISYSPNEEISDSNHDEIQKPQEDHQSIPKVQDDEVLPKDLDVEDDGNAHIWATYSSTLSIGNRRKLTKKRSFNSDSDIFSQYDTAPDNMSIKINSTRDRDVDNKNSNIQANVSNAFSDINREKLSKKRSFDSDISEYEMAPENTSIKIISNREPLPKFNESSTSLASLAIKPKDSESQSKYKQSEVQEGAPIFVKSKMLTKKEIQECYDAQTAIMLNSSTRDMERRMEVIQNLPTVEQMQRAEQVAIIRKTKEGIFCHQVEKKTQKRKRFLPPLKTTIETPKSFILSDRDVKNYGEVSDASLDKNWSVKSITSDVVSRKSSEKSSTSNPTKKDETTSKIMNSSLISKIIDKYLNNSKENNN